MRRVATNVICEKRWKNRREPIMKNIPDSGIVFTHGEGISTTRVRHTRQQPLIKCANMTSIYIFFPFYVLMSFLCLLMFLPFCGRQGRFPLLLRIPQL